MPSRNPEARSPKSRDPPSRAGRELALGIDLGATKVVSALVDVEGRIVRRSERHRHGNDGPAGVIARVVRSAQECLEGRRDRPGSIGIGVAAQIDPATGAVVYAPNLAWQNFPLGERLSDEMGSEVFVVNDARAATFAEWKFGAGVGETDLFCLVLGTGVGGSAVFGGNLVEGGMHAAGEVGHLTIVSGGRRCHCPNSGCFEAYVGGWGIGERAREAVHADVQAGTAMTTGAGSVDAISAETVFRADQAGDPLAARLVAETERYLADGVVGVVNAFNPSTLILAGGLMSGRPEWVRLVEAAVRTRCQPAAASVRVVSAALGEDAGVVGAAALARERVRERTRVSSGPP
jgi:glucokinase